MTDHELEIALRAAFEHDHHINLHKNPITVVADDGRVTLMGQVESIAAKRRAAELAGHFGGVKQVEDRIQMAPAEVMGDGAIRDHVRDALMQDPAFARHAISVVDRDGGVVPLRGHLPDAEGNIILWVEQGTVILEGTVLSRSHRRLAEVLAWWVPGSVSVANRLMPRPYYENHDEDGELEEVIRIVLEKDRLVNADQIAVRSGDHRITLAGSVPSREQREIAEHDVWFVEGVRDLVNELRVP